ncbi:MAG TPA: hypothetical protein VEW67_08720 [Thermoleophilaceae bacterium]|nr:hypothetical protein [Thermoleophilaceae bacterium]
MSRETTHTVRDVRSGPGELSFDVDVCGIEQTIWFKTDAPVTPNADAVLATCLLPAALWGGTLDIDAPISPRLLRSQTEFQAIQRMWSRQWDYGLLPLGEIDVRAPARASIEAAPGRGVATFFSGGVDSWSVVSEHPEVTHLVFVRGLDLVERPTAFVDEVERRLRAAATDLGKTLYVVDTNIRELSDRLLPWDIYFASPLAAVALLLAPLFERFLVTGDADYETTVGQGVDPLVDHLWSTEQLEIAHACGRFSRVERTRLIADDPVAQRALRVCWENRDGAYNCGRCRKCLSTMITLEALGKREPFSAFPPRLDLAPVDEVAVPNVLVLTLWQDILDLIRQEGRADLEPAVAKVVASGKRQLGLPDAFRRRGAANGRVASAERDDFRRQLDSVVGSRSWRLTAPLRRAAAAARRMRG